MRLEMNPHAPPMQGEQELIDSLMQLNKRGDTEPVDFIGAESAEGQLRLRITCHTESESAGVTRLLENRGLLDAGISEEADEDGNISIGASDVELPNGLTTWFVVKRSS
ncbi:MAG: hypothetical protein V4858_01325 [Pseudomonadota bacterium]